MIKLSPGGDNEKNKEVKEASEEESYEDYENEAMENAEEGMEDIWLSETGMPTIAGQSPRDVSSTECETWLESSLKDLSDERKEQILREKWFTVTGKKPKNIPIIRKVPDESTEKFVFFGERKPLEVEKKRGNKMMFDAKKLQSLNITYGKIRQEIRLQSLNQGLMKVKFSPDGNAIAYAERSGDIEIRKADTNKLITRIKSLEQSEGLSVRSLVFLPNDNERIYAGGDAAVVEVYDANSGECLGMSDCLDIINIMDVNTEGDVLAAGGREGRVHVLDVNTLQTIWSRGCSDFDKATEPSIHDEYHRMRIYGLKFHPTEPNYFATGGWDNIVKVWDLRLAAPVVSFCGPQIYGDALDIKEDVILTASWRVENSLSIWDFPSGQLIKNIPLNNKSLKMEGEFLYSAKFFKNNHPAVNNNLIAVGGSGFPEMLVINIYTEKVEKYFPSYKAVLTLDIFQNLVAYGGKESLLRIAEITTQSGRK